MEKTNFKTSDEVVLCGIWHVPTNPTKKAIILTHGITVNKDEGGIFLELAELLTNNGYAVFRFDFRGHGESEGETVHMTITGELLDLKAAYNEVRAQGYSDVGLLGASFGGGIATLYAARNQEKLTCLCLWNPVLNYDHCFLNPISNWLKGKGAQIKNDITTQGWTLLGRRKVKYGKELFAEMEHIQPFEEMKQIKIPTTILHGDADTHVPYSDSVENVHNLAGIAELVTIHGSEHDFHDRPEDTEAANNATLEFFKKYL
jgi:alpha-beta hydrolase superfamily lysophospholipase